MPPGFGFIVLLLSFCIVVQCEQKCDKSSFPSKIWVDSQGRPSVSCSKTACFAEHAITQCQSKFTRQACTGPHQFTQNLSVSNTSTLMSKCCEFPRLDPNTAVVMQVTLRTGEQYIGGEIPPQSNGLESPTHFHLIKDVTLTNLENGSYGYVVTIYQLVCVIPVNGTDSSNLEQALRAVLQANGQKVTSSQPDHHSSKQQTYQVPSYQYQAPISQAIADSSPTPVQGLEPLQPGRTSADLAFRIPPGFPPGYYDGTSTISTPAFPLGFGGAGSMMTLPPNMTLPTMMPLVPLEFARSRGRGRPRIHQAPLFQPDQSAESAPQAQGNDEAWRQWAWRDYFYRNPQYSYYLTEEEDEDPQYCFSGDMQIETETGVMKLMRDLEVGDRVLADGDNTITYQPVVMWLHRRHDQWADFYRIRTDRGQLIEATTQHLIMENDCESEVVRQSYVKDVHVGTCLVVLNERMELTLGKVVNITMIRKRGIYAPMTTSGTIIVNRVLASCYADMLLFSIHQSVFTMIRRIAKAWTQLTGWNSEWLIPGGRLPLGIGSVMGSLPDLFPVEFL